MLVVLTAGAYIPSPLYPAYQHAFGFNDLTLTIIYAAFAIASAPALLVFGSIHDSFGAREVLRISLIAAGAGSMCFAFASSPTWLFVGRICQGVALGAVTAASVALIINEAGASGRGRASLNASLAFVGGTAAGPIGVSIVVNIGPDTFITAYFIHVGLLIYGWLRVERLAAPTGTPHKRWRPTWPRVPRGIRGSFITAATTGFLAWTAAGMFLALGPSLLLRYVIHSDSGGLLQSGLKHVGANVPVLAAASIALVLGCSMLAQLAAMRLDAARAQLAGLVLLIAALAILGAAGTDASLSTFFIVSATAGIGHGLAYHGAAASVDAITPSQYRGGVTAALYLAFYLGSGIPTIGIGVLTLWHPLASAVSWLAWSGVAVGIVIAISIIRTPSQQSGQSRKDRLAGCWKQNLGKIGHRESGHRCGRLPKPLESPHAAER